MAAAGQTRDAIAADFGIGVASVYRILAEARASDADPDFSTNIRDGLLIPHWPRLTCGGRLICTISISRMDALGSASSLTQTSGGQLQPSASGGAWSADNSVVAASAQYGAGHAALA
jgi:hypothetical protein